MNATIIFLIAAIYIYVRASINGYNALRWVIGSTALFFGIQNIIRVLFFLVVLFFQSSPETLEVLSKNTIIVDVISVSLSSCALLLVVWQVSQKPDNSPTSNAERPE